MSSQKVIVSVYSLPDYQEVDTRANGKARKFNVMITAPGVSRVKETN